MASITLWTFAIIVVVSLANTMAEVNEPVASPLTKSIADFSSDLYQNVIQSKKDNIIMSPLSVQIALALAYAGAEGETANVLTKALQLGGLTKDAVASNFHDLLKPLQNDPSVKIANSIYVMENYAVEPKYERTAVDQYFSDVKSLNFADNVNSAKTINEWVESKTNNKIKNLISSDSLDNLTRLVLVNAIYFKGFWQHQFKKRLTKKAPFYTDETNSVSVDMMTISEHFRFGRIQELDADAIELPYNNSDISMLIILPTRRDGLADLEKSLKTFDLSTLSNQMWSQKVDVTIPKFKIEFEISLVDTLKKMGLENIFSDVANFSGLLKGDAKTGAKEPLKISEVVHKAFIDVNEEGAEAAAATGVIMMMRCAMPMQNPTFEADHPFYYVLWNQKTNSVYFSGRVINFSN